jgi:signal transduction histidine kinase/CheY-like chemotaxis protein
MEKAALNIQRSIRVSTLITLLVLLIVIILAFFFQRIISDPILALASITDKIKHDANYSIRLKKRNSDEIGILYDRFNNMLEQIELRDKTRDQTEEMLKKATELAINADKLKSAFLANMSHEIRTPMNSIIGFAGLLDDPDLTNKERKEYIGLINSSCNSLLHLIDDILDISKIEAGQLTVVFEKTSISDVMHELYITFKEINQKSNENRVELKLNLPFGLPNISANTDVFRLKQVLSNLLSNAIKFTSRGHIEFGFTLIEKIKDDQRKKYVKFFVHDSGIGMDQKTQNLIFERFTKLEPDNNKLYKGAGLGLTISKKLIELLEGDIWVESVPESGSSFYFIIPSPPDALAPDENLNRLCSNKVSKSGFDNFESKNILIVEDDPSNYELLHALLKKTSASLTWSKNGFDAIEQCKKQVPDIILMDIKMPDMDGYETASRLRSMKIEAPIIAQTAFARLEDEKNILQSGFNGYLSKPIEKHKLITMLNNYFSN